MSSKFSIETISKYLDGELGDDEARAVEEYLANNPEARREVEWLRKTRAATRPTPDRIAKIKSNVMANLGNVPWALGAPVVGEIAEVRGAARILRPGASEGIDAVAGFAVRQGDRIEPEPRAVVVLRIDDKGTLRIAEAMELNDEALSRAGSSWWNRNRHWIVGERNRQSRVQMAGLAVLVAALAVSLALLVTPERAPKHRNYSEADTKRALAHAIEFYMVDGHLPDWIRQSMMQVIPTPTPVALASTLVYDPTNGTTCFGDAWVVGADGKRYWAGIIAGSADPTVPTGTRRAFEDHNPVASFYDSTVSPQPAADGERSSKAESNLHIAAAPQKPLQVVIGDEDAAAPSRPAGAAARMPASVIARYVPLEGTSFGYTNNNGLSYGLLGDLSLQVEAEGNAHLSKKKAGITDADSLALIRARGTQPEGHNTEAYDKIVENPFLDARQNPLSTFSIDVDTASYANMRRFLNQGQLPPKGSVRIEELVNYFSYDYPQPEDDRPFSVNTEVAACPWKPEHRLVKIGLQGRKVAWEDRPASNLVFLLDVSGSMRPANKLPLVKQAISMLVRNLTRRDRVSIVVYAGASGLVLEPTPGDNKQAILGALNNLSAGGSTNGGSGIQLAYTMAKGQFIEGGINRVILATDGDFNVGTTNQSELTDLIEEKAKSGVFLTVLGFGMGNLKDSTLEKLADKGNGNYAYIDTENEARKALVDEISGTLITIAKDVKIQVEFNPRRVGAYRLIGYENRMLRAEDFNDDTKDAGEIGAGISVTALYELAPADAATQPARPVDPLRYQQPASDTKAAASDELLTVKLRYKEPDGKKSKLIESPLKDSPQEVADVSPDFRFAASVAAFGMLLRDSQFKGAATFDMVRKLATDGMGDDPFDYRKEFIILTGKARRIVNPDTGE